jgi:hypothetical protein
MANEAVETDQEYRWDAAFLITSHRGGNGIVIVSPIDVGRRYQAIFSKEGFERNGRDRRMMRARCLQFNNGEIRVAEKHLRIVGLRRLVRDIIWLERLECVELKYASE